jgi:hypothetical protein
MESTTETATSGDAPDIDQGTSVKGKLVTDKIVAIAKKIRVSKLIDDASYIMCKMDKSELFYNIESFRIGCSFDEFYANLEPRKDTALFIVMHYGHAMKDPNGNEIKKHPIYLIAYNPDTNKDRVSKLHMA